MSPTVLIVIFFVMVVILSAIIFKLHAKVATKPEYWQHISLAYVS